MMFRTSFIAVSLVASMSAHAAGNREVQVSDQLNEGPAHETIAEFDALVPNGLSTHTFTFNELQAPMDVSIWRTEQPSCRGFGIGEIKTIGEGVGAQWVTLQNTVFRGVEYSHALQPFKGIQITLQSDRFFNQECHLMIRKATFRVPEVTTLLAKILPPICEGPVPGSTTPPRCEYRASRVDTDFVQQLNFSGSDVSLHRLSAGSIYKLIGYLEFVGGVEMFSIQSAELVLGSSN